MPELRRKCEQIIEKSNVDWNKIDLKKYSNFEYDENILFGAQLPF